MHDIVETGLLKVYLHTLALAVAHSHAHGAGSDGVQHMLAQQTVQMWRHVHFAIQQDHQ
jgi:hypothetical protein